MLGNENKSNGKDFWKIPLVLSLVVVLGATICIVCFLRAKRDSEDIYGKLQEQVNPKEESDRGESTSGIPIPSKDINWDELLEVNEDIYSWIYIPELDIDYPVVQHPDDNEYYLNHNLDGSKGFPGCVYTEDYNSKDFSDKNTVLYGHNLLDKTMFSALHRLENREDFDSTPYIFIYTRDACFAYEIFAAYEAPAIHQLINFDYDNPYAYEQYQKEIFNPQGRCASYKEGYSLTKDDKIITLSTCTRDSMDTLRFLVQGKLVDSGEYAYAHE